MGFDPITMAVLGVGASLIGGEDPSVTQTDPTKQIEAEPTYEKTMREGLTNNAMQLLDSGMNLQNIASGVSNQLPAMLNQTLASQQGLMNGQLPAAFQTNFENGIRSGVQNTVGNIANNLSQRGIGLNGTSFTNQMNSVNQSVADAAAKNFSSNVGILGGMANNGLNSALGTASSLSQMGSNALQVPYNLYGSWRNSRYGNKAETIVDQGSAPPLAGVGSALLKSLF